MSVDDTDTQSTEHVYLIGCEENHMVKIGRSIKVGVRLAEIQRMSPVLLTVLWQTEGGSGLESKLHWVFHSRRVHGEWFDFTGLDPVTAVETALARGGRAEAVAKNESTDRLGHHLAFGIGDLVWIEARDWPGPPLGEVRGIHRRGGERSTTWWVAPTNLAARSCISEHPSCVRVCRLQRARLMDDHGRYGYLGGPAESRASWCTKPLGGLDAAAGSS
jgi:hypothetical protein